MRVALYLRRSTDERRQADSIAAQESLLRAYAEQHGHTIVSEPYRDNASGRSIRKRFGFQSLIEAVQSGAPFEAVLVRDVTRWGRFPNVDEGAYWEFYFLTHGVRVLYVQEGFREHDPASSLQKMLRRFIAAEFSREKSRLVQYAQYRTVNAGFRLGGDPPYGMRRRLVARDGKPLQVLKAGERKLLNDHRIKLTEGPPSEVRTLRRIFAWCGAERTPGWIAARLNQLRIPSPKGSRWTHETVRKILTNPAYIGTATATFQTSENFATEQVASATEAWPALISQHAWRAAQARIANHRWRKSPDGLAAQLREFFERTGMVDDQATGKPTADTYRKYFQEGSNEAIQHAYSSNVADAIEHVAGILRQHFHLEREAGAIVLDGVLRVGFKAAFPRGNRYGNLHWQFTFTGSEEYDVTVGIAFSALAVPMTYFKFANARFLRKQCTLRPRLHSETTKTAERSLEQLVRGLRRDRFRYSKTAGLIFWQAIKDLPLVNTHAAARALGWPPDTGLYFYHRLQREGYTVPPLKKQAAGRRLTIICEDCGKRRTMLVSNALQHKGSLCATCWRMKQAKFATCPDCGVTRRLGRGELSRLSNGANSRCRRCSSRVNAFAAVSKRLRDEQGRFV